MIAADTSVVVAAFASWHEGHLAARRALRERSVRVPGHVLLETYSVLTRMPPPFRAAAPAVAEFLRRRFPHQPLVLAPAAHQELVERLAARGVTGGAAYDALVATTAADAGALLLSRDRRAVATYEALAAPYELID